MIYAHQFGIKTFKFGDVERIFYEQDRQAVDPYMCKRLRRVQFALKNRSI